MFRVALFFVSLGAIASSVSVQFKPFLGSPTYGLGDRSGAFFNESDNPARVLVGSFSDTSNIPTSSVSVILEAFISIAETNDYSESVPGYFTGSASGIDTTALGVSGKQPYIVVLKGIAANDEIVASNVSEIALFTHTQWDLIPSTPPATVPFPETLLIESSDVDTVLVGTRLEGGFGDGPLVQTTVLGIGTTTPVEDRPAFDDFPDATPVDDSENSSSVGWIVDPSYDLLYLDETSDWVYSETFGWAYSSPASDSGIWFYLADTERWYWTEDSTYPYIYDDTASTYTYIAENDGARFLYDFTADAWQQISE
ncbi:MAG: hypothetical protein ACPGN3_18235 [Opitutales bacterium]